MFIEGSVADQSVEELGGPRTISVLQRRDHEALENLMRTYETSVDPAVRIRVVTEVSERALRHAFAEETVLFPACRRLLPDSIDGLTAHIEGEHQEINALLRSLEGADPAGPDYDACVARTFELIRSDARDEEDDLLPRLQRAATPRQLRMIGWGWNLARLLSPTRPHPRVPRRPPGNALAAVPLAIWDRGKDTWCRIRGTSVR